MSYWFSDDENMKYKEGVKKRVLQSKNFDFTRCL